MNRVLVPTVHHLPDTYGTYGTMYSWVNARCNHSAVGRRCNASPSIVYMPYHDWWFRDSNFAFVPRGYSKAECAQACLARSNLVVKELQDGGIAALHVRRIAEATGSLSRVWNVDMQLKLERLLQIAPALLSEFKPSWGWVFGEYLYEYSHWTYTDVDIVFGRLNSESYAALISNLCQSPQA